MKIVARANNSYLIFLAHSWRRVHREQNASPEAFFGTRQVTANYREGNNNMKELAICFDAIKIIFTKNDISKNEVYLRALSVKLSR